MKREGWFAPYASSYFWRFVLIIFLGALTIFSASSLMYTSGFLISKSSIPPENILMVYVPIVGVRTFGTSRAVIHYVERLVGHDTILRILSKMRTRLYNILEPQALFLSSRFRTGDILGMLADDIEYLQNVYLRTVFPSIIALLIYAAAIIALGTFDLAFALLMGLYMLVLVVVLPLISLLFTQRRQRQVKQERNRLYQKLTDAVLGMGDWMISGRQAQFVASYEADEREVARTDGALRSWARLRMFIGQAVVGLAVLSMLYWAAGEFADGTIAGTLIAAFVLVVFPVADAFLPVSEAVEKIPQYRNSLERLDGVEEAKGTVLQAPAAVNEEAAAAIGGIQAAGLAHIVLKSAGYRYSTDDAWSVQNLSLDLPQGRKVAVIGRSGAGKSTLLKMVQGVITPVAGSATINGVAASALGEQIPQVIAVLNQSPHLFDTTVANNIRLGNSGASEEDIRKAASLAKLDMLISSLPEGYNTPVREAGQRFSGGERQRMALARILLQNTPVVVLDEPTVGLDPRTERELLATMFEAMAGKTLLWVTHHLVGAEQMDEVIFMENGQVEMRGTHTELMEREPRYRKLYELDRPVQFLDAEAKEQQ
ncbi:MULTISPECIES: thiol reductant ABC exporter subunit CydC [unclassified Paenibacillus]|uniref:thiol reductant ABC exporter subunit CydC n=1 Tax=unclassified Paenibacillus TaxID=185978 RepID=UPI002406335D|nr:MULTISPECIES: thiol reductant ABC exporter subunit CydC [unclassified Paenibacillus]MDF9839742.1 ATP-binding cassette subfamily C protein CydC [Paenibacillus sp. PastF-2]MDF9846322.1 ATP-binding cassette subfamily C protein CydC [Paenibacillus sp. PastM-2]MDF9853328.1 ATP-binding cassette subfamily C protein CydC [Paenibacillus sp. PastF-1]MDH6478168.1 ATP-binding cassette subfamily C protein CydC [Paenibacillus sp. PastH-2]MDH6506333.1 ATP-binding cassette subfamily C protein CydC [Paeniba